MFYCGTCEKDNEWPDSFIKSYGKCEMCDNVALCNDVPSRYLPMPKPKKAKLDIDSIT